MTTDPTERDHGRLRALLLGQLTGDERGELEAELLVDDAEFALLEAIEGELLEEYARDELTAAERAEVEARCLATPAGRRRLALARALAARADRPVAVPAVQASPVAATPAPIGWLRRLFGPRRPLAWATAAMVASALAVVVWAAWPHRPEPAPLVAVVLQPLARSNADAPAVAVAPGTRSLTLRLALVDAADAAFTAEVRDGRERIVFAATGVSARAGAEVVLEVPAAGLGPGPHQVWLYGLGDGGRELVARYAFTVTTR